MDGLSGSSDEKEDDFFSVRRKTLNQWVKHTWFPDITPQLLTSNGYTTAFFFYLYVYIVYSEGTHSLRGNLVSLLLTRLFPGTDEKHVSLTRILDGLLFATLDEF